MSVTTMWDETFLPWSESANDRRFKQILRVTLIAFVIMSLILAFIPKPAPPVIKQDLKEISPRLAKLIIEQKKQPPPPPPVPVKKPVEKIEKEKPPEPKVEPKEKPKDEPRPVPQKNPTQARQKASTSGLLALSNKLTTLHDSFDVKDISNVPLKRQTADTAKSNNEAFNTQLITAGATESSKGIGSRAVTKSSGPTQLADRTTSSVQSSLNESAAPAASKRISGGSSRTESEIARVFEENKGAIYSMYNRALRGDPSLQGKVLLEITIEPDGSVSNCRIVSSNLNNPEFEKKIIARVKLFRFKPGDIRQAIIKYPIDFIPS
jgi:periplasmic protein TonB